MNSSNVLFLFMIIMSPIISLSTSDWVVGWIGMEIGMFGLLPLLIMQSASKEAVMKYFLIQSLSSAFIFVSGILFFNFSEQSMTYFYIFLMSMSLKLGFFPGHFWVTSVVQSLSWFSNMLLLGPLKIAPFGFLNLVVSSLPDVPFLFMIFGFLSAFMGSVLGFNQTCVRAVLGASSITHSGWMMISICFGYMWMYMLVYFFILIMLFLSLMYQDNLMSGFSLLSLSGLPPFTMFLVKMKVLSYLVFSTEYLIFIILLISSVISLFFYLKFFYSYILTTKLNLYSLFMFFLVLGNIVGVFSLFLL
uniref:NADH dehydrogenase subunit 2 n=1 Tax=Polypylis sp. TS-2018 TaxID=2483258 RepID=UPI002A829A71|nr:NADH dehydrogenase subunit 2 [Polypylis sp. TS-2018]WOZ13963.1 NADH dehydrogenase subunit 2 [Polypylis sp. TS-2018]